MELTFKGTRNLDFQLRHAKVSLDYMRNRFGRILKKQKWESRMEQLFIRLNPEDFNLSLKDNLLSLLWYSS